MRPLFWVMLAIWLGGALIGTLAQSSLIMEISVNLFGSLTLLTGLFLLGRWAWRKFKREQAPSEFSARGMPIMSTFNVPEAHRDPIEKAIAANAFRPRAVDTRGRQIIHIQTPENEYLAVVSVEHDAVMIHSSRIVTPDATDDAVSFLREL